MTFAINDNIYTFSFNAFNLNFINIKIKYFLFLTLFGLLSYIKYSNEDVTWGIGMTIIVTVILNLFGIIQIPLFPKDRGPKITEEIESFYYLDYIKKCIVEGYEYKIDWGMLTFFIFKIEIKKINITSFFKLKYKSRIRPHTTLPEKCYELVKTNGNYKIIIVNNYHYEKLEIEKIYFEIEINTDVSEFIDLIDVKVLDNRIEIINNNDIEIRNYEILVQNPLTFSQMKDFLQHIINIRTGKDSDDNDIQIIRIKIIEPKQGTQPGVLILPL